MDEYRVAAQAAVDLVSAHVDGAAAGVGPVTVQPDPDALMVDLEVERWIRDGGMDAEGFAAWLPRYLEATVRIQHPGSLIHQIGVPSSGAALADLIHGATNNPMAKYEMGAAGATLEWAVIRWMLSCVGFDREAGAGVLTHGGSLANLTALLAARAHVDPAAWQRGVSPNLALLAPASVHYSIRRSAAILGLGEDAIIELEADELERIRPDRLTDALERCTEAGRRPLAIVAAAPATSTGLHDDLREVGAFCAKHGVWFHVDAAHGASALLSARHRQSLAGIELADSVIWDAHKMLRTSGLCAAVLVRRGEDLPNAFRQHGDYLFDQGDSIGFDTIDRAIESTKTTLGLKAFLSLAWEGERGIGDYVDSRYDLTRRLYQLLASDPAIDLPYEPESNILCFGVKEADQLGIRDRLLAQGRLHIGTTTIAGRRYLRVVLMAPATNDATLGELAEALRAAAQAPARLG